MSRGEAGIESPAVASSSSQAAGAIARGAMTKSMCELDACRLHARAAAWGAALRFIS